MILGSHLPRSRSAGCNNCGVSRRGINAADGGGGSRSYEITTIEQAGGDESGVGAKAGNGRALDVGEEDGGLGAVVASLIALELEGVFRTVVSFL